ncbi:MAG: molybdopterin-synthase adenylyltransferase MoeB [Anaerolineae bacterium]
MPLPPTDPAPDPDLSPQEVARYSRHLIMPQVGMAGQRRLKAASVLLVGAGGLGSPAGLYLAAAGVGRIGLVDADVVDASNLQRQVLYGTRDLDRPKTASAVDRLRDLNPHVELVAHQTVLDSSNALQILADYDIVVDGSDNFPTRYLVNDACVLLGKPDVYGSIFRFDGQAAVFWAAKGPCYRCLFPEPPPPGLVPSCAEGGVLGVLPGIIGSIQANEAIKLILGAGESLIGRLLLLDALSMRFQDFKLPKDPACPACGERPTLRTLIDYQQFCGIPQAVAPTEDTLEILPATLRARLDRGERLILLDVRDPHELAISQIDGGLLIPLSELAARLAELDPADEIVAYCRTGVRSARAVAMLRQAGFPRVHNLVGGINRWAEEVDGSLPRY